MGGLNDRRSAVRGGEHELLGGIVGHVGGRVTEVESRRHLAFLLARQPAAGGTHAQRSLEAVDAQHTAIPGGKRLGRGRGRAQHVDDHGHVGCLRLGRREGDVDHAGARATFIHSPPRA